MSVHMQRELDTLKKKVLSLGGMVEENLRRSFAALKQQNPRLATEAREHDKAIDRMEVELEEECLKALALYQPVAWDLRYITSIIKINHDLERIGDQAVNMAKCVTTLRQHPGLKLPDEFDKVSQLAQQQVKLSLDAMAHMDSQLARQVWIADQEVDDLSDALYDRVKDCIRDDPALLDAYLPLIDLSRYVERIGDHAVNIAKDILYMEEGEIVRHRGRQFKHGRPSPDGPIREII